MLDFIVLILVVLIFFSILFVIISKQPVLNVLFLILSYILVIFLYLILGLEFIALITCIVYVGAITILFLFTVMLLNLKVVELNETFLKYIPIGSFIGLLFFFEIIYIYYQNISLNGVMNKNDFDLLVYNNLELFNLELFSYLIYDYYFLYFLLSGFVLFLAIIGSIMLTLTPMIYFKKQDIYIQLKRNYYFSLNYSKNH